MGPKLLRVKMLPCKHFAVLGFVHAHSYQSVCLVGPAIRNLGRYAARSMIRHPDDDKSWVLTYGNGSTEVFVNPSDSVAVIKDWLDTGVRPWFYLPEDWENGPLHMRSPGPLVISGPVKVRHIAC